MRLRTPGVNHAFENLNVSVGELQFVDYLQKIGGCYGYR